MHQEKSRDLGFLERVASADGETGETETAGGIRARGAPPREAEEGEGNDDAGGVRWRLLPRATILRPTPDASQNCQARLKMYVSRAEVNLPPRK